MCVRQTGVMCVFRCVCVLLCVSVCVCLNLQDEAVMFSGPTGSLFGFSVDFHTFNNKSFVVIGAPKANTSQSGVMEGGGVFLCPWSPAGETCNIIKFDVTGDEVYSRDDLFFQTFKSQQWFGASVRSISNTHLLACAPLFHLNVQRRGAESGKTPVGNCLLLDQSTGSSTYFSPCRGIMMEEDYKRMNNRNDQRYCEVGFSSDITKDGRLLLGAPGSFYFQGQVITAAVSDVINSGRSNDIYVAGISQSDERGAYDVYHGYSVASGLLTGDSIPDYLVGVPNDRNTAGSVKIYDGRRRGSLTVSHSFQGAQVASYFGHSVAVADINSDGLDDVLIGAPLYMDRVKEQLQERGQVVVYLQRRHTSFLSHPDQSLIGLSLYGRFGSALAVLGDLDMDGYQDIAVGAPWSGDSGQGQVFVYLGNKNGLSTTPSQVIDSPLPSSRTAFGFTLRGGADIDGNGYPDLLVGAWSADRAFVYRSQAVIRSRVYVSLLPDFLNPDVKLCHRENTLVSCFVIQMCVYVSGHRIPQQTVLGMELQLDRMKQPMAKRTLLLSTNQPQETMKLIVQWEVGVACVNRTAYLRSEEEVRDKLSPIFINVNISLLNTTQHALLHGQTHAAAQTRIILDCGADNVCIPDLRLSAEPLSDSVLVGEDQSVVLSVSAENHGEGAYETELVVQIPEHTHFQSSQGVNRLVCVQRKENQTVVVTCDLGNPMRQGHKLQTRLVFSVGRLEEVESHITFNLRIRSKNSVNSSSNKVTVKVQVKAEATLEIRGGSSPPEIVLPLPDWQPAMHPGSLEEVGPLVEHVYELRNQGPSAVNARLTVDFPSTWRHHFLLYIISNASEESLNCRTMNASQIDPFKLAGNSSSVSVVSQLNQQEETNSHTQTQHVRCSSSETGCVRFVCDVMALERGSSAVVRISARLWTHTLTQTPYLNYELVSSASYDVINASSRVQPLQLPSGHTQTQVSVLWRSPDGEKEVPIGYIILSIISGLLLLGLLCFIFWKLGFFRRVRPPTDDDDEEEEG
ncbi:integrin alpha-IIb isoform X1 [Thunnus maccoyii]|uniref:integrin alpha-IIb isoform X1 n=3 Tax=Thunnus maccoyii TaxID=8240 RepID=UPI001C4C567A|nr:integrin alpha-IIb isoform X1 [Thunnus maccoyii]XP_042249865.1 integrin alpha-IIb isoform X1 [Thunnus maccoyii]XP_042249866.1 integrin alpha-IIb isoform X1 [Thunnus maccoyii]